MMIMEIILMIIVMIEIGLNVTILYGVATIIYLIVMIGIIIMINIDIRVVSNNDTPRAIDGVIIPR